MFNKIVKHQIQMQSAIKTLKYFPPSQNMLTSKKIKVKWGAMYLNPEHLR